MRDPKGSEEYQGAAGIMFIVLSLAMMLPMFFISNVASITFLVLGTCLFIGSVIWVPIALYEEDMSWAFLFETETN